MPTDRRTFLLGAAVTAGVALAGCSGGDDGPRPPREEDPDEGETTPDGRGDREGVVYTPNVADWEARESDGGNLTLAVELQSIHPSPTEGTMRVSFQTVDGGQVVYTAPFEAESENATTVAADLPVRYDEYRTNMSLPDFTFTNVTER